MKHPTPCQACKSKCGISSSDNSMKYFRYVALGIILLVIGLSVFHK